MPLKLTPYFVMNGNAAEAIDFYQKALDAKVIFKQTFQEMPENPEFPLPEEAKNLISHAMLQIGESELMFSDQMPGSRATSGDQLTICITSPDKEQSEKIFAKLSDGGKISMPLQETFFSPAYGMVTDKFGIAFQLFTEGKE